MKIGKDPTIVALNDILSRISEMKKSSMKNGNLDMLDAYEDVFRFVLDIYSERAAEWKRKHPISAMIMNIRLKRRSKRFREMTAEIRGTWL